MDRIGIIGIGMLGNAVALHLLDLGYKITAFNIEQERKQNRLKRREARLQIRLKKLQ